MWDILHPRGGLGARFRPLDREDFERREWIPHSGWPFGFEELEQYYQAVHELLGLGSWSYQPDSGSPLPSFRPILFRLAPAKPFLRSLPATLSEAPAGRLLYHATVVSMVKGEHGEIVEARVKTPSGKSIAVTAKVFVLAAGGIENPRLLLLSGEDPSRAIGNAYDLVGRFFMEHPHLGAGVIGGQQRQLSPLAGIGFSLEGVQTVERRYALRAECARAEGVAHYSVGFRPTDHQVPALKAKISRARRSAFAIKQGLQQGSLPPEFVGHLARIITEPFRRSANKRPSDQENQDGAPLAVLSVMSEQVPNPASRVRLDRSKDVFGRPRARLHWRLSPRDITTLQTAQRYLASELRLLNLRILRDLVAELDPALPSGKRVGGGAHHMGTTRMHRSPRNGVVDENCRVHGSSNLFVAGSSVFPTSGYANPTMTILALSLRLADHLERLLRPGPVDLTATRSEPE